MSTELLRELSDRANNSNNPFKGTLHVASLFLPYSIKAKTTSSSSSSSAAAAASLSSSSTTTTTYNNNNNNNNPIQHSSNNNSQYYHQQQQQLQQHITTTGSNVCDNNSTKDDTIVKYFLTKSTLGNIGLQNAIATSTFKKTNWIGIPNQSNDSIDRQLAQDALKDQFCYPVWPSDDELDGHYHQFCKQVLWKPFHYQLQDYPKSIMFEERAWEHYVHVNKLFANEIVKHWKPGDIIFVNDYHLMLVPSMVRKLNLNVTIGFFLHIPFPSSEIFRCIHVRKQILNGLLLGCDLIGFQTYSFMRHFLMTCSRLLSLESTPHGIQLVDGTIVSVGIFPIGIDLVALNEKRRNPNIDNMVNRLKERYNGLKIVIGRDKNDYVKGVRQKMLAYERFLLKYPQWRGKVVLIQVVLSTPEAFEGERVSQVVGRINSTYGTIEYSPVLCLHQDIDFDQYLALLTVADTCLITSLRDGMNLTSHEYVVCQEGKHGPLIISEFAGTYGNFSASIRVNPWDTGEVADAIHEALSMNQEDKYTRWCELYSYVSNNTAQNYVESFINEIQFAHTAQQDIISSSIPVLQFESFLASYTSIPPGTRRIFFLDLEGTLLPASRHNSTVTASGPQPASLSRTPSSILTAQVLIETLTKLTSDPKNVVYIMSGKCKSELDEFLAIPNIGLSAENGAFIRFPNDQWTSIPEEQDTSWFKEVEEILTYYTDRTPGSYIETKQSTIIWHYHASDINFGTWQAAECQNHLEQALSATFPIHVTKGLTACVEVSLRNVNKAMAVKRALENHRLLNRTVSSFFNAQNSRTSITSRNSIVGTPLSTTTTTTNMGDQSLVHILSSDKVVEDNDGDVDDDDDIPSSSSSSSRGGVCDISTTTTTTNTTIMSGSEVVDVLNGFIVAIGNDKTDEVMFEYLNSIGTTSSSTPPHNHHHHHHHHHHQVRRSVGASITGGSFYGCSSSDSSCMYTVTVGPRNSCANYYLPTSSDVLSFLGSVVGIDE